MVEGQEIIVTQLSRKQIITLTICALVILISGIAIGIGSTIMLAKNRFIQIAPPRKTAEQITKLITEKYALTPEQTAKVQTLLTDMFNRGELRRSEMDAQRDAEAEQLIVQMKTILTDEQFVKWNENFVKLRAKFKQNRPK